MTRRNSFLIAIFILGLILFDAAQQHYYINTFNLSQEHVTLVFLLKSHLIRWAVWGVFAIPFGWFIWRKLQSIQRFQLGDIAMIFSVSMISVLCSVFLVSLISIRKQGLEFNTEILTEFFVFFVFQKGLTFFLAYCMMIILLYNYFQYAKVKEQQVELITLRRTSEELLKKQLPTNENEEPYLSIKTGSRMNQILLSQVIWIQADDYCVRVHTEERSYTLRKSLKSLETQLSPFRFLRIHRGALLNLNYIDQINFESSTIRLQNEFELPLSRSGVKSLKKRLKETSI